MADVRDLLGATTPDATTLFDVDHEALARRGARRRVGKRLGATALSLALVGGGIGVASDLAQAPQIPFVDALPGGASWVSLPSAPMTARAHPQVLPVDDGRVVIAGGAVIADDGTARFLADADVLYPDRTSYEPLPDVPFTNLSLDGIGRAVEFTLRGRTLWAHAPEVFSLGMDTGANASNFDLARLDLDAPDAGWEQLPEPPLDGTSIPVVTVVGDEVVVLGGDAMDARGGFVTSGAVWRDGAWSPFDEAPLGPVSTPFVGVDEDHLAIVGGVSTTGTIAGAAVLDLDTLAWRRAPDHPLGPRAWLFNGVNTLVVDGRMLVAGGIARPGTAGITPDATARPDPTVEEFGPVETCIDLAVGSAPDHPKDVSGEVGTCDELDGPSSDDVTIDVAPTADELAPGVAWLDLASVTWEIVDADRTTIHATQRPDGLSPPPQLSLSVAGPGAYDEPQHVLADGALVQSAFPTAFSTVFIDYEAGDPVLALGDRFTGSPDTRAALYTADGGWAEVTLPGPLEGVTYTVVGDELLAVGGLPYELVGDDPDPTNLFAPKTYDRDGVVEVRVLRR